MMFKDLTANHFADALRELGHNPDDYRGKRLTLNSVMRIYDLPENLILDAIDKKHVGAHYDYLNDLIWIDALEAAHFYYCILVEKSMKNASYK